eukprot:SAG31_NODE_9924_length_1209_cov_1.432432_2_plen_110_part_00
MHIRYQTAEQASSALRRAGYTVRLGPELIVGAVAGGVGGGVDAEGSLATSGQHWESLRHPDSQSIHTTKGKKRPRLEVADAPVKATGGKGAAANWMGWSAAVAEYLFGS